MFSLTNPIFSSGVLFGGGLLLPFSLGDINVSLAFFCLQCYLHAFGIRLKCLRKTFFIPFYSLSKTEWKIFYYGLHFVFSGLSHLRQSQNLKKTIAFLNH